ncbi:MAG: type II toxin-antitoxin system RelE/ParE family toxin [Rhodoblastus sp.]|nr:type II toxin-antitoxin system RelE/ParE family toxin [Rhodoblastus sp.]
MKLRFVRRAVDDVAAIADYVRERNPGAALRVRTAIYDALADLLVFPHAGRRQSEEGIRKFVTPRFGYLIYYAVDEEAGEIVVLAVKHPAQRRAFDDV